MRTTKIKIGVKKNFYRSFIEPDVPELKDIIPTPLWKMKDEWWFSSSRGDTRGEGTRSNRKLFTKTFVGCPSTKNWVNKSIMFPMPEDIELTPDIENDRLEIVPMPDGLNGWNYNFHSGPQLDPYTKNHLNIKWMLPYTIYCRTVLMMGPAHLHKQHFQLPFSTMQGFVNSFHAFPVFVNTLIDIPRFVEDYKRDGKTSLIIGGSPLCYVTFPNIKGRVDVEFVEEDTDNDAMHFWAKAKRAFLLD